MINPKELLVGTFDEVKKKADDLVDQAKSTVGGLADQQATRWPRR